MKTLNLGCGDRIFDEYPTGYSCINLDNRADLHGVDVVSDVRDLSRFNMGEFDYILASDIIEHFPVKYTIDLISEWCRVLKINGIIEVRTPNLKFWCEHYVNNKDAEFASHHLYGGQDYEGNFHYVCFDRGWLKSKFESLAFKEIDYSEDGSNMVIKYKLVEPN